MSEFSMLVWVFVVDNYDSFVFMIVGYLVQFGVDCEVVCNDLVIFD